MTGRRRQCAAAVALALALGVVASLLGASVGARFVSFPGQGHDPMIVRGVVTDVAASVPRLPRVVLPTADRVTTAVTASTDSLLGVVTPVGLLLVALGALATLLASGRRGCPRAVMSAQARRAPPGTAAFDGALTFDAPLTFEGTARF